MTDKKKPEIKNVHQAILYVMGECGYVQKQGTVSLKSSSYKYAGEADLIRALRPAMLAAGLTCVPTNIQPIVQDDFVSTKMWDGKATQTINHRFVGIYTFVFTHAESGTQVESVAAGDGIDTGDKAVYKAATGALKYALRQSFIIETGDDPDATASPEIEPLTGEVKPKPQAKREAGELGKKFELASGIDHPGKSQEFLMKNKEKYEQYGEDMNWSEAQEKWLDQLVESAEEALGLKDPDEPPSDRWG